MNKILLRAGAIATLAGSIIGWNVFHADKHTAKNVDDTQRLEYEYYYNDNDRPEDKVVQSPIKPGKSPAPIIEVDTDPQSVTVLVNRDYLLPEDYIPPDLVVPKITFSFYGTYEKNYMRKVAATALEKLFAAATEEGIRLRGVSAYRSYSRQKEIYNRNVSTKGEVNANKVSAVPGSSEHQTGLTIDVSSPSVRCALEESFGNTTEGKWLAKNCYKYGFIIRYPKGKEDITGYSYEPWHLRYVGKNLAKRLHKKKMTMEEYYQTTTVNNKVKPEEQVKDTDVGAPQQPQMTSAPTPHPSYKPVKTSKPKETEAAIPEPEKTKKPKKTEKPIKTDEPDVEKTEKPKSTPKATQKPTQKPTKEPEVTTEPDSQPEITKEPNRNAEVEP
ncbi:MAG: D-alanyl-D-alanine carboxypeptidase family protein [Lachnospiraceae bacterium]|nr:D-alanyl-D-alanine carboxypeptidase family protein [Lachnospiraceae bacterium]